MSMLNDLMVDALGHTVGATQPLAAEPTGCELANIVKKPLNLIKDELLNAFGAVGTTVVVILVIIGCIFVFTRKGGGEWWQKAGVILVVLIMLPVILAVLPTFNTGKC